MIRGSAVIPLKAAAYGTTFDAIVEIGSQPFEVLVDTGSSDLWVLGSGWQCVNQTGGSPIPRTECNFGNATYHMTTGFESIEGVWLGDQYGDGDAIGFVGATEVRIGNLTIPRQELGIVNRSSTSGDGVNVGILGLGYPSISAIHPNSYGQNNSLLDDRIAYPTVFERLIEEGVESYFSLALERTPLDEETGFGGYLGLGTLPPIAHGAFISMPVEITSAVPVSLTNGTRQISEWTLTVDSTMVAGLKNNTPFQAVVDSGNWLNILPEATAKLVNDAFSPPGSCMAEEQLYVVACNATPPSFSVNIGDATFPIDGRDMIWRDATGTCYSSVAPAIPADGIQLMFLGDAFLKNVVAVFDVGKNEMWFAERPAGTSAPCTSNAAEPQQGTNSSSSHCTATTIFNVSTTASSSGAASTATTFTGSAGSMACIRAYSGPLLSGVALAAFYLHL